jgi:ABC-2 type transport system permease protein
MTTLLFQLRAELWKLFARKRSYMGFVAFALLQVLLWLVIRLMNGEAALKRQIALHGEAFDKYISAPTFALLIMNLSIFLLGGLYLALVSGDIVAKESEDGQMRLLLARPISRLRLLGLKFFSCSLYAFLLIQFAGLAALILGVVVRGWGGGLFAWMPELGVLNFFDSDEAIRRYVMSSVLMGLLMTAISSIGFFLSCFKIKPAAATIGALSYITIDSIIRVSPFMKSYKHLLITKHMSVWSRLFMDDIPWPVITRGLTTVIAVDLTLFVLGVAVFASRDLKS